MAGFDPVGSTPVGAIGTAAPSGAAYTPASGSLQFTGSVPDMTGTAKILPLVAGQLVRETIMIPGSSDSSLLAGQLAREIMLKPTGELAIGQMVREVLVVVSGAGAADDTIISIIW